MHMTTHYFSKEQSSALNEKQVRIFVKGDAFDLLSADGIFSKEGLDFGTRLLIESSQVALGMRVLDLGCGNGVVGIALLRRFPKLKLVMSDVNERAVETAKKNAEPYLAKGCTVDVRESDLFKNIDEHFDAILVNPPYAAGREVCYAMIEGSKTHLAKGGFLELVARHAKGGIMLEKKIREVFGNVQTIAKRGGFRVYVGRKS